MSSVTFSGLASGIDSSALIESLIAQQRKARVTPLENKISKYQDTKDSLTELKSLLNNLKDAADKFKTLEGGVLSKTTSSTDESVLSTSTSNLAALGNYDVTVKELAKSGSFSFSKKFSSATDLFANGVSASGDVMNITVGGETTQLLVGNTTTVEDLVNSFNAQSTKGQASLINVGTASEPSYAFMITSKESGLSEGKIEISVGEEILAADSKLDPSLGNLSQAKNSKLSIAGLADNIERNSNTISDLIPGVSFKLNGIGTVNIATTVDSDNTSSAVKDFVDAFNNVVSYIKENDLVSSEKEGEDTKIIYGSLSSTSLDENILSTIKNALTNSRTSGGSVNILSEVGITTNRDGTISFDADKFEEALSKDSNSVNKIFTNLGEELGGVTGKIYQFTGFNALIDQGINNLTTQINDTNNKIGNLESYLSRYEQSLTIKYANLEALMGKLNSQQNSLSSIIASI